MKIKKSRFGGIYLPLVLIIVYLSCSYLLYRFGCYIWPFRKDVRTLIFMLCCILFIVIGYLLAARGRKGQKKAGTGVPLLKISAEKVLIVSCAAAIVMFLPICKAYTNSWYPPVIRTLLDPKGVYYELSAITLSRTGIRIWAFLDVFSYILFPLTLWAWDEVKKSVKIVSIVTAIGYLMIYISSARNIMVAVQMLSIVAVWLSIVCVNRRENEKRKLGKITLLSAGYIALAVCFFSMTMSARIGFSDDVYVALRENTGDADKTGSSNTNNAGTGNLGSGNAGSGNVGSGNTGSDNIEAVEKNESENVKKFKASIEDWNAKGVGQPVGAGTYSSNGLKITEEQLEQFCDIYFIFPNYTDIWSKAYANMEDPLVRRLPGALANLYIIGSSYITNGYNCLTVALHSEHQWTYGFGHSTFLSSYIDRFLHTNISGRTYYQRLSNDQDYPLISKSLWPSAFVQLADDLTFIGAVLFMAVIGFVIAKVWKSILIEHNYWGVLLLGQLMLGVLFLPANNILGNSGGFFVTFWSLFIAWFLSVIKRKENI